MYLVDTNVLSQTARTGTDRLRFADVADWLDAASPHLFVSVVTIAEIEDGAERLRLKGATQKAAGLVKWLAAVEHLYGSRILPLDVAIARVAGRLSAQANARGAAPGFADAAIAATAQVHDLTVLTRNVRHFEAFGARFANPFEALPELPTGLPELT